MLNDVDRAMPKETLRSSNVLLLKAPCFFKNKASRTKRCFLRKISIKDIDRLSFKQ